MLTDAMHETYLHGIGRLIGVVHSSFKIGGMSRDQFCGFLDAFALIMIAHAELRDVPYEDDDARDAIRILIDEIQADVSRCVFPIWAEKAQEIGQKQPA